MKMVIGHQTVMTLQSTSINVKIATKEIF